MGIEAHHPLTRADYVAEGPNAVRVTDGGKWGLFDRFGGWIEGERARQTRTCASG